MLNDLPLPAIIDVEGEIHALNHIIELAFDDLDAIVSAACAERGTGLGYARNQAIAFALHDIQHRASRVKELYIAERYGRAAA